MIAQSSGSTIQPFVSDTFRQKLLMVYTKSNDAASEIIAWSLYDGTANYTFEASDVCEDNEAPYHSVLAAMRDGWRVMQVPRMDHGIGDRSYEMGVLPFEWALEQWERIDA